MNVLALTLTKLKTVIGKEHFDGTPCERYINCSNPECNKQILVSEENEDKYLGACSYDCAKHERNRYVAKTTLAMKNGIVV